MASTYSNLKIQLMATGENSGTWGNVTNDNLGIAIEQAITGSVDVTVSSDTTLSLTDTNAAQNARALRLNIGGSGGFNLTVPSIQKLYLVNNATLAAVVVKNASGSTVTVPTAKTMWVFSTGSGVVDAVTHLSSLTLGSALPIASGGTGSTSTTYANLQSNVTGTLPIANGGTGLTTLTANNVLIGNGTSNVTFVAPGSNGNVLTSNGSAWTSTTPAAGTTFSAGTTGFTPNTATSGAVTLSGTLAVANGGTGGTTQATARAGIGAGTGNGNGNGNGNGTVTSVATGNGLSGGTITSTGTLAVACPSANTVGSYASVMFNIETASLPVFGSDYSAGSGNNQLAAAYIPFTSEQQVPSWRINVQLSGSWRWMGASNAGVNPASYKAFGLACRVS